MQLKGKMARLNLALDRAMTNPNKPSDTASQQPNGDLQEGLEQLVTHQNQIPLDAQKQLQINKKLNDLLCTKDAEIQKLCE